MNRRRRYDRKCLKEFSRIADYDKDLAPLQEALVEIDSLLGDFCRDLSSYMDSLTFDEETFLKQKKDWIWSII